MPRQHHPFIASLVLLIAAGVCPAIAAPPFELTDDGRVFVYRARPGEAPSAVAASFGVPEERVPAFLAANGIADATRVPLGFAYRIPNPLAPRIQALSAEAERLERDVAARTAREAELERALAAARAAVAMSEEKDQRLASLEARWPMALGAIAVTLLGLGVALWVARLAVGRLAGIERHARALAQEVDERRRASLAEKQDAAKRILDLEERVRQLERQPRLVAGARS